MDNIRKNLEKQSNLELRKIDKKLTKAVSGNYHTRNRLLKRADEAYDSISTCCRLRKRIRWLVGKRKGIHCPALKINRENGHIHSCRKRTTIFYGCGCDTWICRKTSYNFFHECVDCKRSRKQAFNDMVYINVFQKKGNT